MARVPPMLRNGVNSVAMLLLWARLIGSHVVSRRFSEPLCDRRRRAKVSAACSGDPMHGSFADADANKPIATSRF